MISPDRLEILQLRFAQLLGEYRVPASAAYPVFDMLAAAYQEPHRDYHNLEHLAEMFRVVGKLPTSHPRIVALAVWFHDAVYDPHASDNEERSAALARRVLSDLQLPAEDVEAVERLILATKHDELSSVDADTAVLLDADLAILGAAPERYHRYASAIRREYQHVADEEYRIGRLRILENFLARERIYRTDTMIAVGEEAARTNITTEITHLRAEIRPNFAAT